MEIQYRRFGRGELDAQAQSYLIALLRDTPLYASRELSEELFTACMEVLFVYGLRVDTWCVNCRKETTFTLRPMLDAATKAQLEFIAKESKGPARHQLDYDAIFAALRWLTASCARVDAHVINYICKRDLSITTGKDGIPKVDKIRLTKIGQYPSAADIALVEVQKYAKELGAQEFREFNRAIGLASHDVGIGSFVYLRRIVERLVTQTAQENLKGAKLEKFKKLQRAKDRISAVKQWLPSFLVDNQILYGILSKGIHELAEEECLAAFEPCRAAIELILDEHVERREKQRKIEAAATKLNELNARMKGRKEE